MKRDCPHCRKSMGGRFLKWRKVANQDNSRNCPLCGGNIAFRMYPEEVLARLLAIAVMVVAAYMAKERAAGYLAILVTATAVLVAIYVGVTLRLQNQQRYRKNDPGGS